VGWLLRLEEEKSAFYRRQAEQLWELDYERQRIETSTLPVSAEVRLHREVLFALLMRNFILKQQIQVCVCIYVDPCDNNTPLTQVFRCEDCPHPDKHQTKHADQDIATLIFAPLDTKTAHLDKNGKRVSAPGHIPKKRVLAQMYGLQEGRSAGRRKGSDCEGVLVLLKHYKPFSIDTRVIAYENKQARQFKDLLSLSCLTGDPSETDLYNFKAAHRNYLEICRNRLFETEKLALLQKEALETLNNYIMRKLHRSVFVKMQPSEIDRQIERKLALPLFHMKAFPAELQNLALWSDSVDTLNQLARMETP